MRLGLIEQALFGLGQQGIVSGRIRAAGGGIALTEAGSHRVEPHAYFPRHFEIHTGPDCLLTQALNRVGQ